MSNKTISINPGLFSLNGSKTKKKREKKEKPTITPLISPNLLKNKLLKRIKEHKLRETENLDSKRKQPDLEVTTVSNSNMPINTFSDEFSESIDYLQTLSKQKKVNDEKRNFEAKKQQRKNELERKTIKNYQNQHQQQQQPFVNIDLPEELQQPLIKVNTNAFISDGTIGLKPYSPTCQVPYGVLKGGQKPTYRDWTRTQRNTIVTNPNSALTIQHSNKSERENRLHHLREKIKMKQLEGSVNSDIMMTQNLIQKPPAVASSFVKNIEPVIKYIQNGMIEDTPLPNNSISTVGNNNISNIIAIKIIITYLMLF